MLKADMLDLSLYEENAADILNAALDEAQKVYDDPDATQAEIDLAESTLPKVMETLEF